MSFNLALLSLAIALLGSWILFYTDWFLLVGGLAGMAGTYVFLANLLPEKRREELQEAFEERFLDRQVATWTAVLLVVALLVLTNLTGTLVVRSLGDETHRSLTISRVGAGGSTVAVQEDSLPGRSRRKLRLWTGFGLEYRVKLSDLPAATLQLGRFQRSFLDSPDDFLSRPVVLVRPSFALSQIAKHNQLWLIVERQGEEIVRTRFTGKAVWIGCDADVAVPSALKSRWQFTLLEQDQPATLTESWLPPIAPEEEAVLAERDSLRIWIETTGRDQYGRPRRYVDPIAIVVPERYSKEDFPIEVVLDVPHLS